ncbi:MAG: NAD-dependent epimerase/dehydratase family protein [Promethearchaeota archaeon]
MTNRILVTGGAGFIGSHLIDDLLESGHDIIVYDILEPQVHGINPEVPEYLAKDIKFIRDDIKNRSALIEALNDIDVVIHLAAMVGVGQSMYQIDRYTEVNTLGTARLLDILVNEENNVKKIVVASSMSTYGEGAYSCKDCGVFYPGLRSQKQLEQGIWEIICEKCGNIAKPIPTDEHKPQDCTSIYALTKKEQEKMVLLIGDTYGINATALRLFNVYGSRQSLLNPYTGVCAIFSSSLLNNNPPTVYEDGNQTRDFVHVKDICQGFILSMKNNISKGKVYNVGSGKPITINDIAKVLCKQINPKIKPNITNKFRFGDVRHCFSDISKISSELGYSPNYNFEKAIKELVDWLRFQRGKALDKSSIANKELKDKGLIK